MAVNTRGLRSTNTAARDNQASLSSRASLPLAVPTAFFETRTCIPNAHARRRRLGGADVAPAVSELATRSAPPQGPVTETTTAGRRSPYLAHWVAEPHWLQHWLSYLSLQSKSCRIAAATTNQSDKALGSCNVNIGLMQICKACMVLLMRKVKEEF